MPTRKRVPAGSRTAKQPAKPTPAVLCELRFAGGAVSIRADLVVDVPSMTDLHDGGILVPMTQICDFGTSETVYHTNYFVQDRTLVFLRGKLLGAEPSSYL